MKKHRKLFYVPGMITLVVFPILCYYKLQELKKTNKEEKALEVIFASKPGPRNSSLIRFDTTFLSKPEYKRNYLDIKLNGCAVEDKIKLDFLRLQIREIKETNDTKNGVHLVFVDSVKYGTYVAAINMLKKEEVAKFALYNNNMWYFNSDGDKAWVEAMKKKKKEREAQEKLEAKDSEIIKTLDVIDFSAILRVWPVLLIFAV